MTRLLLRVFAIGVLAAGCTIGNVNVLGGREKCWDPAQPRVASLMKGTLRLGPAPRLDTPEGETLPLSLARFDLGTEGAATALKDPGGGGVVAVDGELVTLFGGIGSDGSMFVCRVEERHPGP